MKRPPEADDIAKRMSESLIKIHDSTGPLTPDQRASLMLSAGFIRGQASRIQELERKERTYGRYGR